MFVPVASAMAAAHSDCPVLASVHNGWTYDLEAVAAAAAAQY